VESQGIVLLEAAASGLPIVAVHAETLVNIVHESLNGHLVKPEDIGAFSKAMVNILHNPDLASRMGRQSRIIAEGYEIQKSFDLHERFYSELIRKKHPLPARKSGVIRRAEM
jgi:glycosyltransferase involved in cell wall biosynthesis